MAENEQNGGGEGRNPKSEEKHSSAPPPHERSSARSRDERDEGSRGARGKEPSFRTAGAFQGVLSSIRAPSLRAGLGVKLMLLNVVVLFLVATVMIYMASGQLESSLQQSFESKGEAIALSLAAADERNVGADVTAVQGQIDANAVIHGVKYIYIARNSGEVVVHNFAPNFPPGLQQKNRITLRDQLPEGERVQISTIEYELEGEEHEAIDVAAPVAGGALGNVHIGMDPTIIEERVSSLQRDGVMAGGSVALLGVLVGLLLTMLWVVRPIGELTRVTAEIVRKGDLTQKIKVRSSDEIGQLADSFQQMVEKLRAIPLELEESTGTLTESVGRLTESASEQLGTVTRQASALQQAQATVQEIKQTSLTASQRAEAVLEVAERADEVSKSGEGAIEESLTALTDIRAQVEEIAQRIVELTERTRQIGLITETVKDLADQSNMLALNAAIEAVRSGEHGKGFAVVAREIRSLADQSIQATNRVREILDDISGAIRGAVSITEKGTSRMEGGLTQVRVSGEKLRELSAIVRDNSSAARQIAAAVSQQNAGISQISTAVNDLNEMMDDTIRRIEDTNQSVEGLREVSDRVSAVVRTFRV